jgi:hypothetical protein
MAPAVLTVGVGVPGAQGPQGPAGPGVPVGGTAGQYLQKIDGTNYNTDWTTVNLSAYAVKANNLSDLASTSTARTNLGLGSLAVVNDAPSDGSQYARKNAAWEVVSGGGGGYAPKTVLEVTSSGRTITSPDFGKVLVFTSTANGIIYLPIAPLGSQVLISFIQEDCKQVEGLSGVFVYGLNFNDRLIHYNSGLVTMTCVNSDNATFSFWRADNPLLFTTSWPAAGTVLSEGCVDTTGGAGYVDDNSTIWYGSFTHSTVTANGTGGSSETLVNNANGCYYPNGYCSALGATTDNDSGYVDDASNIMYYWSYNAADIQDGAGNYSVGTVTRPVGNTISAIYTYGGISVYFAADGSGGFVLTNL